MIAARLPNPAASACDERASMRGNGSWVLAQHDIVAARRFRIFYLAETGLAGPVLICYTGSKYQNGKLSERISIFGRCQESASGSIELETIKIEDFS